MKRFFNRLLENKTVRKILFFGGIILAFTLFVVVAVIRVEIRNANSPLYIPEATLPPNDVQQVVIPQYSNTSTQSWANGAVFGTLNKSKITGVHFVSDFEGHATGEWTFDGLQCFVDESMIVYIVVEDGVNIDANMDGAFANLPAATEISGLKYLNTSKVTSMNDLFKGNKSLTTLDLIFFKTDSLTSAKNMFADCQSLTLLDMSTMNLQNLLNADGMFKNTYQLAELSLTPMPNVKSMKSMFQEAGNGTLDGLTIQGEITMGNCIDATAMFKSSKIKKEHLEQLSTHSLKVAASMFENVSIYEFDLSKLDMSKVEDASYMFANCQVLTSLNVSGWKTPLLHNTKGMFYNTYSLTELTIDWTDVEILVDASDMFNDCTGLVTLDLSAFNNIKIGNANQMFKRCVRLTTICCNGFVVDVGDTMFKECPKLPSYNSEKISSEMANTSGYFTSK